MNYKEKILLDDVFDMGGGYVSDFSNSTLSLFFADFDIDIYSDKYSSSGNSKARRVREFWELEDDHIVGTVLKELLNYERDLNNRQTKYNWSQDNYNEHDEKIDKAFEIATRLLSGQVNLNILKGTAETFDSKQLQSQIKRIEQSINDDPELAIGTAKELIETTCKTILRERGKPVSGTPDMPKLTKITLKELNLIPEGVPSEARGKDVITRLLQNLGAIGNGLAELRGMYGTGHGKDGNSAGLKPRHARLAVGSATTLATFMFDTHQETKESDS